MKSNLLFFFYDFVMRDSPLINILISCFIHFFNKIKKKQNSIIKKNGRGDNLYLKRFKLKKKSVKFILLKKNSENIHIRIINAYFSIIILTKIK